MAFDLKMQLKKSSSGPPHSDRSVKKVKNSSEHVKLTQSIGTNGQFATNSLNKILIEQILIPQFSIQQFVHCTDFN